MKDAAEVVASYNEKMIRLLAEIARMEGVDRFGNGKTLPASALENFQKVLGLFDSEIAFLLSRMRRRGQTIQCKPHCSYCCHQMPANVSTIELIAIYHQVQKRKLLGKFIRRSIRMEEAWAGIFERCRESSGEKPELDHFREMVLTSFLTLNHPCPFLEDELCTIYDFRPLSCRMHFSFTPAHWCNPSHFQNPHAVSFNLEPVNRIREGLSHIDAKLDLGLSEFMVSGLLGLAVNIMRCDRVCLI